MSDYLTKNNVLKALGWAVLLIAVVVLGVPLVVHVLHLGLAIVKLVIEASVTVALFALGLWLIRR